MVSKIHKFFELLFKQGPALAFKKAYFEVCGQKNYQNWFFKSQLPGPDELSLQKSFNFRYRPKISLVVPVFNPEPQFLVEMLDSVLAQTYGDWELCIADGKSNDEVAKILKEYTEKDVRIKVLFLDKNYLIAENTNRAIALATGEYMGLLDHDDLLTPNCLFEFVRHINESNSNNYPDVLYSDEDKIDDSSKLFSKPYFKPGWSLSLIRTHNYMCHLTIFKFKRDEVFLRTEMNGAQDYDLYLRLTESAKKIVHISKILYHWRIHDKSTASSPETKKYTHEAGRRAIETHLKRLKIEGWVLDGKLPNSYKIKLKK